MLYVICYIPSKLIIVWDCIAPSGTRGQWWRRTDITRSYTFLICSQTPLIFLLDTLSRRTPHLHCSITRRDTDLRPGAKQPRCWRCGWLEQGKLSRILRGGTGGEVAPHALELSTGLREIYQYYTEVLAGQRSVKPAVGYDLCWQVSPTSTYRF